MAASLSISSVSPTQVNINLPFTLTVTGAGFVAASKVMLGTTALTTTYVSATQLTAKGTTTAAAGTSLAVTVVNSSPAATSNAKNITVLAPVKVAISPTTASIRAGDSKQFSASVQNAVDKSVRWFVNAVEGGDAAHGTVDTKGLYKAPAAVPSGTVTVAVKSVTDPTAAASSTVTLLNPLPAISSVTPASVSYGSVSLTVNGSGFASGAKVMFGSAAMTVGSVSTTQITATGTASPVPGGLVPVTVVNPDPGGSTSAAAVVSVALANPKVSYNAAYRFLEQATFGADPASIAHLQQVGFDQWFNEQAAATVSQYTDPPDISTGFSQTQQQFWADVFNGPDQLRQRVAFTLSQIWVISGVKVPRDVALLPWWRTLNNDAFGTYLTLMKDVTLNPAMGNYLDMVNNDKFDPKTGTAPNENYAREILQLFTIGLTHLNSDGTPTTNPPTPTYDQTTIATLARVFTGWTYPPIPGTITLHHNQAMYFAPMVAIESNHDTDPKTLFGTTLPSGTAEQDLDGALNVIFNHPNVGPFVALRLIQHMVKSNPSPAYVGRVAAVFNQSPRGNLLATVKAVLLDPEARAGDTSPPGATDGHLREPVLLMTHFLKALGATVVANTSLTSQGTNMNQQLFYSPSVFNYYSPFTTIPDGTLAGPEFQLLNPSTSLVRPNFIYSAVTSGLGSSVTLDLSSFVSLAAQPDKLLDALNTALMHGAMQSDMRGAILTALNAVSNLKQRTQYAAFLVGSSSQYQVEE